MQIEDYLYQKDLHEPLTGVKPDSMTEEQWKLKDRQALGMIRLTLTKNVAFNIVKENTTAGLMKALSNMYEKPYAMNKALILLSSMPESWDTVVAAISSSRGTEKLRFDEIRDVVLSEGHFKVDCKKPKKKQNQKSGDDSDSVNSAEDIGDALILSVDSPVESWILDSGASFHSSPSKELFQNFKSGNFGKVYLADNKALVIEGKGDVSIKTPTGNQWTLKDARYIPGLKKNLISIGCINMAADADGVSSSSLWHDRLGHMSVKGMRMLAAKGTLEGLTSVDMGLCESCVMGKQKRVSFTKTPREPKKVRLEMLE
ncbi:unnamed protein product [Cuscuta campestris]|uniref:Uncharacterized protein n=1 Tax=Cuscuta campestris TaxID=132261 RepID=A0A484MUU4_9ASTE|nr:unnamed protein product [Cuscuta campestris]